MDPYLHATGDNLFCTCAESGNAEPKDGTGGRASNFQKDRRRCADRHGSCDEEDILAAVELMKSRDKLLAEEDAKPDECPVKTKVDNWSDAGPDESQSTLNTMDFMTNQQYKVSILSMLCERYPYICCNACN